jgi:2-alkenal reductase
MAQNERRSPTGLVLVAVVVLSLVVGAFAGGVVGGVTGFSLAARRSPATQESTIVAAFPSGLQTSSTSLPSTGSAMLAQDAPIDAVRRAGPAVVTVITTLARQPGQRTQTDPTASGSGIILDKNGYILTNNHVIDGQQKITIIFANGDQSEARLVGGDSMADLAILKVDVPVPAVAVLGDSDALVPGEQVLAIGSALGDFRNTITAGIVSGLGRRLPGVDYRMDDLIQTDAAINHGNSGGPLVNLAGQVVGINVAIYRGSDSTTDGTVEGVGFAIPVDTAKIVAEQIILTGKVTRSYIGVSYQMLTPQLASYYKVGQQQGAYVTSVVANSPASKASLQEQDVILAIDDKALNDTNSLFATLLRYKPGDTVRLKIQRGAKEVTTQLTLGERPADAK